MNALTKIKAAGFALELEGGKLAVEPFSKLTPAQIAYLKQHKAEIIQTLQQEQAANDTMPPTLATVDDDRHYCHECQRLSHAGLCMASKTRYKPVDDIPRRCPDFVGVV